MKYVIIVHSSLTYSMARQAMKTANWPEDQVIWVVNRKFSLPDRTEISFDISDLRIEPFKWSQKNQLLQQWLQNRQTINAIDEHLAALQNDFLVVLPLLSYFPYYTFISNPSCRGFYLLEEGKLSYTKGHQTDHLNPKLKSLFLNFFYRSFVNGRVPPFPPTFDGQHPKYLGAFCISDLAFPSLSGKIIIPSPFGRDPKWESIRHVLVLGPYVEFGELPPEVQLNSLEAFFIYLKEEGIDHIYFKFHPVQLERQLSAPLILELMKSFQDDIRFEELAPSDSLEEIAASSKAKFYLATSSVAIYAVALQSEVYSYAKHMIGQYPDFEQVLLDIPKGVVEKLHFLTLNHG